MSTTRRALLAQAGALGLAGAAAADAPDADEVGSALKPWRPGRLDIHHIATGRGDSTLVVGPDGSTLLIDAGATAARAPPALAPQPSAERRPGEWIGRYVQRRLREIGGTALDFALITHQHPDHLGDVGEDTPWEPGGAYQLTGVTDVAALTPIRRLVDRGYPTYDEPVRNPGPFQANYQAFVQARARRGALVERLQPGALNQLRRKRRPAPFPSFEIRNLAVNGRVWTGAGEESRSMFPPMGSLDRADVPEENVWSAAIRVSYGGFSYFAAGDLTSDTFDGALPWRDVESAAARVAGAVDVAVTPHHGMFDSTSAASARALRPRIWIVPAWHAVHPSLSTLHRLFNPRLYPGPRDVFATGLDSAVEAAAPWLMNRLSSRRGHVVVRAASGGGSYRVVVTDNQDELDRVEASFGPFPSDRSSERR